MVGLFWMMATVHGVLYFNVEKCWFSISPRLKGDLEAIYSDRLPRNDCDRFCWLDTLQPLVPLR